MLKCGVFSGKQTGNRLEADSLFAARIKCVEPYRLSRAAGTNNILYAVFQSILRLPEIFCKALQFHSERIGSG